MSDDRFCSIDGQMVAESQAAISPFDRGFLYGDAVYDIIPLFDGHPFKFEEHVDRLYGSAGAAKIELPHRDELSRQISDVLDANSHWIADEPVCRLGIWFSRGVQQTRWSSTGLSGPTSVIFCWPVPGGATDIRQKGPVRLAIATRRRLPREVLDPRLKMTSRLPMILGELEGPEEGDVPLFLADDGRVTETSSANVFVVLGETIATPQANDVLEGVTRTIVLRLARELGYATEERDIHAWDCQTATEAFLTSSTTRVTPVRAIAPFAEKLEAPGPVTVAIADALNREIAAGVNE